ncbi:MAG: acyl-CoA dehydratase activase [Bacteroidales bacterium]
MQNIPEELAGKNMLGIDAGALSIKIAIMDGNQKQHLRRVHHGEPLTVFYDLLDEAGINLSQTEGMVSGRYASVVAKDTGLPEISPVSVLTKHVQQLPGGRKSYIVDIGASGLAMAAYLDGGLQKYETNSLCAAGTGAFLDQQMSRLGLTYQTIQDIPVMEDPPSIACRCSVFAKSDLIHRQQAGYAIPQLWNGLVKGLALSAFSTLFRGTTIDTDVMMIGGLANNKVFLHFFESLLDGYSLVVPPNPDFFLADALVQSCQAGNTLKSTQAARQKKEAQTYEHPLRFTRENNSGHEHYTDTFGNEVDLYHLPAVQSLDVYLGVDVGSTSTKLALLDKEGHVCAGLYTRTAGRPVHAFQQLLKGVHTIAREQSVFFKVRGAGTTGSGRNLLGAFTGADLIKNEITAHLKGAVKEFPDVKTIFEIGGQDAKYISVEDGWMKDANMNYVCAAGTGSFLEEQAKHLNIELEDIEKVCKDALPPVSSHRCTVFMEQDAGQLLTRGIRKSQVMASIIYAVCKNYLHRVVHNRPVESPILFLGATAKNKGLVEAFEHVLGKPVHTSIYSHLTGAIGVADMVRKSAPAETAFKGFFIKDKQVSLSETVCDLCHNRCRITGLYAEEGERMASWGYQCGREPDAVTMPKNNHADAFHLMKKMIQARMVPEKPKATLYYPPVLHFYTYNPFWQQFFYDLGIDLMPVMSRKEDIGRHSQTYTLTDCCYPAKLAVGRVIDSLQHTYQPVFLPHHIQDQDNPRTVNSFFCPLSQALPSVLKSTLNLHDMDTSGVIAPVVDFSESHSHNIRELTAVLQKHFDVNHTDIKRAWHHALTKHQDSRKALGDEGSAVIHKNGDPARPKFVILGRSYNLLDDILNLDIVKAIAAYGYDVIPMDMLPVEREDLPAGFEDMYWSYGQQIIVSARYIREQPGLYPVFLTNFNCGPDSFLLSTFEQEMRDKPALVLELDEHGGDGGYKTRLEAFFDRTVHHLRHQAHTNTLPDDTSYPGRIQRSFSDHRIYIPPMHPISSRIMGAALRAYGFDAVALQKEDAETWAIGSACVRGSECMPAASTIGSFIHLLQKEKAEGKVNGNAALFMPCTDGPCRFGQYVRLHERILEDYNVDATIISPNSDDNYGDIKGGLRVHMLKALTISDVLNKLVCRVRPYEKQKGTTDKLIEKYVAIFEKVFEHKQSVTRVLKQLRHDLHDIKTHAVSKPLVGVVGEIYVRNSPFSNADLIRTIENSGGEVWVAPIMEWLHYTNEFEDNNGLVDLLRNTVTHGLIAYYEQKYMRIFGELLRKRREPPVKSVKAYGKQYMPDRIEGESILTIGRAIAFYYQHADLVVNVAPFGCMPGSISASILKDVSSQYGMPIVSLFYDGETDFSHILETYIQNRQEVR